MNIDIRTSILIPFFLIMIFLGGFLGYVIDLPSALFAVALYAQQYGAFLHVVLIVLGVITGLMIALSLASIADKYVLGLTGEEFNQVIFCTKITAGVIFSAILGATLGASSFFLIDAANSGKLHKMYFVLCGVILSSCLFFAVLYYKFKNKDSSLRRQFDSCFPRKINP